METASTLADSLASPPWIFTLLLALFLAGRGSRWLWSRAAGLGFMAATTAALGIGLSDAGGRRSLLDPERLPVVVLVLSSAVVLWIEMRQARRPGASGRFRPAVGDATVSTADVLAATAIGLVIVGCAWVYPARLGVPADPASPPELIAAPWFLAGLQELNHYFVPWVAFLALPLLLVAGFLGLPLLVGDLTETAARRGRAIFLFAWLFLWLWPMALGTLLRDPGWTALSPYEPEISARPPTAAQPFSEIFWVGWLHRLEPARWWLRELPGLLLSAGYFVLLPMGLLHMKATRGVFAGSREALGPWRFHATIAFVLTLLLVPLAMYGRWLLNIGPWIHLPELSSYF